jgi:hypothetical protein
MPLIHSDQVSAGEHSAIFPAATRRTVQIRVALLLFSGLLALYSLWQLAAIFAHPAAPYFLPRAGTSDGMNAPAAALAAHIAVIRGDFWFDDALLSSLQSSEAKDAQAATMDDARTAVIRSARLSPHNSRAWLLLALIDSKLGQNAQQQSEALKMSYYTGPDDKALVPWRIGLAVQSPALGDPDFLSLVSSELLVAMREPALRPVVAAAYGHASADGKRLLESSVGPLDPDLLANMKAAASNQIPH